MFDELSRRGILQLGTMGVAALSGGGQFQQLDTQEEPEFSGAAYWLGPRSARPEASDPIFDHVQFGGIVYEAYDGARWQITTPYTEWTPLNRVNRVWVHDESDLPAPTGGTHTLADNMIYSPVGFVAHQYPLELATTSPIIGAHGGTDGFIYVGAGTGRGAAIQGTNANFLMRDCYLHAPGATLLDISADTSTEMLVESYSTSDAAGLGNAADLGTIDGYRVPTFKGSNFEQFDAGLTFPGNSDKVFFSECPFRNVSNSGVTILEFANGGSCDIIDITDCYVKGVQSDTVVIDVDAGYTVGEIFQYRGVTHDPSVTESNVLTGEADVEAIGYRVRDSHPLPDSAVTGELNLDSPVTVSGSGTAATEVSGSFTLFNDERTSISPSGNGIQYDGRKTIKEVVHVTLSATGANATYEATIAKNGTPLPRTTARAYIPNASTPAGSAVVGTVTLETGDEVSVFIENVGSSGDLDVETYDLTV